MTIQFTEEQKKELGKAVGIGFASGFTTMLAATVMLIPVSYVMNRFIYHGLAMRIMMGFVAVVLSPLLFVGLLISRMAGLSQVYYFGMIPIRSTQMEVATDGSSGWGYEIFAKLWNLLTHPFNMENNAAGYAKAVETLLVPAGATVPVVNERLFTEARKIGAIADRDKWEVAAQALVKGLGGRGPNSV